MKLIGSSKKSKHAADRQSFNKRNTPAVTTAAAATAAQTDIKNRKKKKSGAKKAVIIICSVLGFIVLLLGAAFAVFRWEINPFFDMLFPKPDEIRVAPIRTPRVPQDPDHPHFEANPVDPGGPLSPLNPGDRNTAIADVRSLDKITFLILGVDGFQNLRSEGGANTDVIMVASFDMETHQVEVVSIMRDTVMNVPWNLKKANSIYASMMVKYRNDSNAVSLAMADTKEYFADFLGFNVDFWVMLDMEAFVFLVNALPAGGVLFDVPREIHLEDPDINLDVHLYPGEQLLNGTKALALVRNRKYSDGDFGRVDMQQKFLKAAAEQVLSRGNSIDPVEYANIFLKYVKTDLELNYLVRVGRELLKVDSGNIGFHSAPCSIYSKSGTGASSYVTVHLDEWLEIVNDKLNPFYHEITPLHVSILTLNENRKFYVTDDHWQGSREWVN